MNVSGFYYGPVDGILEFLPRANDELASTLTPVYTKCGGVQKEQTHNKSEGEGSRRNT